MMAKPASPNGQNAHRYLVTMPYGIGDTVHIGLAVVDQILRDDPLAFGAIDVLCNYLQAEVLEADPRLTPIAVERDLFPTQQKRTWYKGFVVASRTKVLLSHLQQQNYRAVFPGNAAFGFAHRLGCPIMYPAIRDIKQDFSTLRRYEDAQASRRVRQIVNRFFGDASSLPALGEPVTMYVTATRMREANAYVQRLKRETKAVRLIVVAPDTTSRVTRPPIKLFAAVTEQALRTYADLGVLLLPSYDSDATSQLYAAIPQELRKRIIRQRAYPRPHLASVAALTDCVDAVLCGDTGVMHLAATDKVVVTPHHQRQAMAYPHPENGIHTIALFGGTNPGLYGHPTKTIILGRGNPVQRRIRPGFLKEGYNPGKKNYFAHLQANEVFEALARLLDR